MTTTQIERRRRWIELIEQEIKRLEAHERVTSVIVDGVKYPSTATLIARNLRKLWLSRLLRVRRCPECFGKKYIEEWLSGEYYGMIDCPTCGGTGRL